MAQTIIDRMETEAYEINEAEDSYEVRTQKGTSASLSSDDAGAIVDAHEDGDLEENPRRMSPSARKRGLSVGSVLVYSIAGGVAAKQGDVMLFDEDSGNHVANVKVEDLEQLAD